MSKPKLNVNFTEEAYAAGERIDKLSVTRGITGQQYNFDPATFCNPHPTDYAEGKGYAVKNEIPESDTLTFGLAQTVMVNSEEEDN